jgi:hypothetical protein
MGCTSSKFKGDGQRLGSLDDSRPTVPVTRPPGSTAPMVANSRTGGGNNASDRRREEAAAAAQRRGTNVCRFDFLRVYVE